MASEARRLFDRNSRDVEYLLELKPRDAKSLGASKDVSAKSAVVLITAFWEAYCEDLAAEALSHLVNYAKTAEDLPKTLRKRVAGELKSDPHELAIWQLSGEGWRDVLQSRLNSMQEERNRKLNTPNSQKINDFFDEALGIPEIATSWKWEGMTAANASMKLDAFVKLRGDIAHRGRAGERVSIQVPKDYLRHVKSLVSKTGGRVNSAVRRVTGEPLWMTSLSAVFEGHDEKDIIRLIRKLPDQQKRVLELRFALDNTKAYSKDREIGLRGLSEVGSIMNLHWDEVRLIESEAIKELRLLLRERRLKRSLLVESDSSG